MLSSTPRSLSVVWDRNWFWPLYKRLEKEPFSFELRGDGARVEIERAQLAMLLEGIEWKSARQSSRFASTLAIQRSDATRHRTSTGRAR